jgi:16S rRNA (cytidine1402-2'-O)-methyltransferase
LEDRRPEARVTVARELTKRFEEVTAGTPREVAADMGEPRGELTVVIGGVAPAQAASGLDARAVARAAAREGLSHRTITNLLRAGGLGRREAYDLAGSPPDPPEDAPNGTR